MSAPSAHPDNTNIDRIHSAAHREKADLVAGSLPAPTWVIFLGFIVAIIAGGQLGVMTGGSQFETSNPFATSIAADPRPKAAVHRPGLTELNYKPYFLWIQNLSTAPLLLSIL